MNKLILLGIFSISFCNLNAQKLITREAFLKFYSSAAIEDIEASTKSASSVIDLENGELVCQVLMKSFVFEKALMQEHFNENYVESDQYPKAIFKGKIDNWQGIDLSKNAEYQMIVSGTLSLHGQTINLSAQCTLTVYSQKLSLRTVFLAHPKDFNIDIPTGKKDNISSDIEITFKATYKPL